MFEVFFERATQFSAARKLMEGEADYSSPLALLAVHSAISWNDAVLFKLIGGTFKGQDHMDSPRVTEKHCVTRKLNTDGISQLKKLVREKSKISYGDHRITPEAALALSISAERFEKWAVQTLERLA